MKWLLVYFSTRSFFLVWLFSLCFSFILTDNEEAKPEIPHSLIDTIIGAQISNSRECMPVNAKSSVPGGRDASLELTITNETPGILAVAIYNFYDQYLMGVTLPNTNEIIYTCTEEAMTYNLCSEKNKILFRNSTSSTPTHAEIKSTLFEFTSKLHKIELHYDVKETGVYCAIQLRVENMYEYESELRVFNANGGIPAESYPKLPFFGVTCIVYSIVFLLWMGKSIMHWKEILPVQKYIAGVIGFLALETFINYLYFHYWNMTENPSYALLFLSALTNAGRISISFFILLIVSMGYGVVKPSLGKDMWKCQLLTAVHFFIGSIYAAMNLKDPRQQKFPILLIVIPLAMTMTVFYAWTLSSLTATTQHLETRRQHFKLQMYQRLWHILLFAGINLLIFFIFQSIWFAKASDVVFLIHWWRWRWMITDGWTNVLYTVCMLAICYLWRPTTNNARYGLEQVLSDPLEDEFDVDFSELYPPPPPSSSSSITKSKFTHPTTTHTTPPPSFHENTMFTLADSDDEPMQAMGSSESAPHYHRVQRRSRSNSPKPPGVGNMDPKLS